MTDYAKQERAEFIAELSDTYHGKRKNALDFLRQHNRYVLDKGSRPYTPVSSHGPQAMVQLRTRL